MQQLTTVSLDTAGESLGLTAPSAEDEFFERMALIQPTIDEQFGFDGTVEPFPATTITPRNTYHTDPADRAMQHSTHDYTTKEPTMSDPTFLDTLSELASEDSVREHMLADVPDGYKAADVEEYTPALLHTFTPFGSDVDGEALTELARRVQPKIWGEANPGYITQVWLAGDDPRGDRVFLSWIEDKLVAMHVTDIADDDADWAEWIPVSRRRFEDEDEARRELTQLRKDLRDHFPTQAQTIADDLVDLL